MQLSPTAPAPSVSVPRFSTPAFRVEWDFEVGGDDEGRSDLTTYAPKGQPTPVGFHRSVVELADEASDHALTAGGVWGAFQSADGANYVAQLAPEHRVPSQFGRQAASVAQILKTVATDQWKATRLDDRLVAIADARSAADAASWTPIG